MDDFYADRDESVSHVYYSLVRSAFLDREIPLVYRIIPININPSTVLYPLPYFDGWISMFTVFVDEHHTPRSFMHDNSISQKECLFWGKSYRWVDRFSHRNWFLQLAIGDPVTILGPSGVANLWWCQSSFHPTGLSTTRVLPRSYRCLKSVVEKFAPFSPKYSHHT